MRNAAIPKYLRPVPFQKVNACILEYVLIALTGLQIRFLGGKLGKALAEEFEVSTVGDLLLVLFFVFRVVRLTV